LTAIAGGAMTSAPGYIPFDNSGGGIMNWTAVISYSGGKDWLTIDPASGQNNASIRIWAKPQNLTAGTYQATITVDAGSAGSVAVPLTLTVQASPAPLPVTSNPVTAPPASSAPAVTVNRVVNAATYDVTPLVAGS